MGKTQDLFEGEFVIKSDGIYTYAHYYGRPESKRSVVIVGMNHGGDKEYFEQIVKLLADVEIVLYEGLPPEQEETAEEIEKEEQEDLLNLASEDVDEAFYAAIRSYFRKAHKFLRLVGEGSAFDYSKTGWESGDAEFFVRLKNDEKLQKFMAERRNDLAQLTPERKREVVEFVRKALKSIESGQFTKKDFGDGFVFFWSDQKLASIFLDALGKPRDEIVMEHFDRIISEKNPHTIGIKFGAAHIAYQRKLLEQHGYILKRSVELKNIAF
ncbi:MAG: hypothetical protein HYW79_03045 [Parcubacteria group bacterium]|nr:hypothetical protein [Parcubacteria group bacterium]